MSEDETKRPNTTPVHRLGLLVFGTAFLVLFVVLAVADGIGSPSVPSGDVALVQDTPGDVGELTKAKFDHALELTAAQTGAKKPPKPGDPKYKEMKESAINASLEPIWLQGVASEWGIEVTEAEIAKELKKLKKQSFKSEAEFKKFLKESHFTSADVNERVKVQILSKELQEALKAKVPKPSHSEIEGYYEAAKATQFTQAATRDIRQILNKDKKKAEKAKELLEKDNSDKSWKMVAKEFSEDPSTKDNGGLSQSVTKSFAEESLGPVAFSAPEDQLEGPIKTQDGYYVFEITGSTPESAQDLKMVESQIESTLAQRNEQEYFTSFVSKFNAEWRGRTFCAPGYVTERCSNFASSDHPSTAPAGCYEAHPKGGLPKEGCPALVEQVKPALPGTVTPLEPKGKPLAQRPRPEGLKEGTEGEASSAVPGGIPPTAAPPSE